MLALILVLAQFDDDRRKRVLNDEHLLSEWRGPIIALAVAGFVLAVVGHLVQSKGAVVTGIAMVFAALLIVPIVLYVRGP